MTHTGTCNATTTATTTANAVKSHRNYHRCYFAVLRTAQQRHEGVRVPEEPQPGARVAMHLPPRPLEVIAPEEHDEGDASGLNNERALGRFHPQAKPSGKAYENNNKVAL